MKSTLKQRLPGKFGAAVIGVVLLGVSLQGSVAQKAPTPVMSLPGAFSVNSSGAALYNIPIVVPPGTAGMTPSLSLEYSSQTGGSSNGWLGASLVGVGWSLGGLPAVGRCPETMAQDGVIGAVNYNANDRFCLDGQRLTVISGTYGADGAEYRTEVDSFSRIISHGSAGTGPAWFEVHTKSGHILQFGNTSDSQILAQGQTTARSWAVNKVSDTTGDYYTITYVNDATNGQAYPSQISYTANDGAGLASYNSVHFVYATRPDITPIYHAGSLLQTTVRLTDVETYAGSTLVADYRLAYQQGSATGRSQLASVTLCGGSSNCLPATTFTWQNGTTTPNVTSNPGGQNGTLSGSQPYLADFNGDGLTDILWDAESRATPALSTGTRVLWTSTGAGSFNVTSNFAGQDGTLVNYAPIVGDFNRDGRADVWWYQIGQYGGVYQTIAAGPTTSWLSSNSGTYAVSAGPTLPAANTYWPLAAVDINGDHTTDLLWIATASFSGGTMHAPMAEWEVSPNGSVNQISNDAGSVANTMNATYGVGSGLMAAHAADFNADGFADLIWPRYDGYVGGQVARWLGNGDGTFTDVANLDTSVNGYLPNYGDFNGDGQIDILWDQVDNSGRGDGANILWMSRGDGTFVATAAPSLPGNCACIPYIADFNGDGRSDILWVFSQSGGLSWSNVLANSLWLSNGDGTFTVVSNFGPGYSGYALLIGDFNGDGKADIMWDSRSSGGDPRSTGTRYLWLSDGVMPDLMTEVTTGLGATTTITYKSITDSTVYTKDNTATDPTVDVQASMAVVARVDRSNSIGGTVSTSYTYAGAKMDNNGRGFLGFRQMTATDLQTNIVQTTNYRQDYPYLFEVASESRTLGSITLSSTTNTYASTSEGGTRYQVYLSGSQTSGADLDGSTLPTTTSSFTYDGYNNATQIAVSLSDGSSKTTNNTYTNNTTAPNWLLGRLTGSTVTSQAP